MGFKGFFEGFFIPQRQTTLPHPKLKKNAQNFFKTIFPESIPFRQVKI
jgi:hypothetical protein